MSKYLDLSIKEIHELLVKKEITPLDLVDEALSIIEENKDLNAFITINDKVREEAENLGEVDSDNLFFGIPIAVKDNIVTKDLRTTCASHILDNFIPIYDATVVKKIKDNKMLIIGKANMDEFAMGSTSETSYFGTPINPHDKKRVSGGSSGGSAVSVAGGLVPLALGTDTGGSIRQPSSYTGIVGMKPTYGRISRYGLFPFAQSLDSVGYFARSVDDLAILTTLLAGYDEKDMSSSTHSSCDYLKESQHSDKKVVGYFPSIVDKLENKKITESFYRLIEKLEEEGYKVVRYDFNQDLLDAIYPAYMVISCAEATSNDANLDGIKFGIKPDGSARTWEEYMVSARTRGFSSLIKRRFIIGSYSLLAENQHDLFLRAQKVRRLIVNAVNEFFTKCDYLLLPTAQNVAKKIEDASDSWSKKPEYIDNHMAIGNFGGYPSLSEPLGYFEGLPYGVNITSRQFEEADLFNFARCIENIVGLKNSTVNSHKEGI